eukprot:Selendium_serpulae@DN6357_c0_g2_i2.p1
MSDPDMPMTSDESKKEEIKIDLKEEPKAEEKTEPKEENESDPDEDDADDEDDPEIEPDGTPEELTAEGKKLMEQEDFTGALSKFSWAVQKKEKSLDSSRQYHPELASYWLDYGDALLIKEENSNELFSFSKGPIESTSRTKTMKTEPKSTSSSSSGVSGTPPVGTEKKSDDNMGESEKEEVPELAEHEADATITDEQLAWENLEMARMCFENKLQDLKEAGKVTEEDVVDATFVNIRLGDILTLQEKFADAAKEFGTAIALRKEHNLPYTRLQAPTLSLAQAQLFADEKEAALTNFKTALKLLEDNLAGVDGLHVLDDKKADFEATVEDLKIQISETEKTIA